MPERRSSLGAHLGARLRRLLWRLRALVVVEGLSTVVGFWAAAFAVLVALDYSLRLTPASRAVLLAPVAVIVVFLILRRLVPPLRLRMTAADAAHILERREPRLASLLVSAVRFAQGQIGDREVNSPTLADEVVRQANALGSRLPPDPLRRRRAAVSVAVLGVVATCLAAWASICGSSLALALRRTMLLSSQEWPKRTDLVLDVEGDLITAAKGDDLEIPAHVEGVMPRSVDVVYATAEGQRGRQSMTTIGERGLRYTFTAIQQEMTLHLEGGDDRTRQIRVRLSERPRILSSSIRVQPPQYSGLPAEELPENQRLAKVLPGSQVDLRIRAGKPLVSATVLAGETSLGEATGEGDAWQIRLAPAQTTSYFFVLTDAEGLSNKRPERFTIRLTRDEPPTLRLLLPGVGDMITPEAELPLELDAADDLGLADVHLAASVSSAPSETAPLPLSGFEARAREYKASMIWPVSSVSAAAGQTLTLSAEASDLNDVTGPGVTRSLPVTLRVVTAEELSAELARREQEYRSEFQRLADQQEELRRSLLTAADQIGEATTAADRAAALAPLERRQRSLANAVALVARQFARIIDVMRINHLDALGVGERMRHGIVAPLDDLASSDLVAAADLLKRWSREGDASLEPAVDVQQAALLERMRAILAQMRETEGYHEAVAMLQEIIRLQKELNEETKKKLESEGSRIFDD